MEVQLKANGRPDLETYFFLVTLSGFPAETSDVAKMRRCWRCESGAGKAGDDVFASFIPKLVYEDVV